MEKPSAIAEKNSESRMQSLNRFLNNAEAYPILRKYEKPLLAMFKVLRLMVNGQ